MSIKMTPSQHQSCCVHVSISIYSTGITELVVWLTLVYLCLVIISPPVPVSKPVLSVVGGTLVLGKRFQLLCHSVSGTLPIVYTLYGPNRQSESRVVSKQGEEAIFNSSAIYKRIDVNNILCHAKNNRGGVAMTEAGQLLQSTNIIGTSDAAMMSCTFRQIWCCLDPTCLFHTEPVSQPVLHIISSTGDISEGQDVSLVCSVKGGSFPIKFTWYHIDREGSLASQTSWKLEESYKIMNVRRERNGGYYCTSTNPAKETKQSQTVTIKGVFSFYFQNESRHVYHSH